MPLGRSTRHSISAWCRCCLTLVLAVHVVDTPTAVFHVATSVVVVVVARVVLEQLDQRLLHVQRHLTIHAVVRQLFNYIIRLFNQPPKLAHHIRLLLHHGRSLVLQALVLQLQLGTRMLVDALVPYAEAWVHVAAAVLRLGELITWSMTHTLRR